MHAIAPLAGLTDFSKEALELLRDPSQFKWYTVTFISFAMYVYANEVERENWSAVLAGLALWCADWINEIVNGLVLHFTDRAAIWTTTGETSYLILIGLTIEISFMFLVAGVIFVKSLPKNRTSKILGIPNRVFMILLFSCFAVFVEVLLEKTGYFHWSYWWWNTPFVVLIVLFGYGWFFVVAAWVYDMEDRRRQVKVVATMASLVVAGLLVFGTVLGWI